VTQALDVARRALEHARGEEAEAVAHAERSGLARFAASEVHQPTLTENVVLTLRVLQGRKAGIAITNRVDDEGLEEVVARARDAAASAVEEESFPGLAEAQPLPEVQGFDPATAELGPEDQARRAAEAIAAGNGIDLYGFWTSGVTEIAVASTTGIEAEQAMTDASVLAIAADEGLSGYAEATSWRAGELDPAAVTREAVAKAERTREAVEVEPAHFRAVLEPYAVSELLQYFSYDSFGALGVLEERSFLAGRFGQPVFDEKVTIRDDALDARGLPKAFDFEGVPKQRVQLVEGGVVRGVVWDRETAAQAGGGEETTGHAPPALARDWGPLPTALEVVAGEAESVDELAELVGEGIYVTRLHYLSIVHPRDGVITGMTRDGTFRIRDGKVAEPLVNLRFTVSVPQLFADVPGLTRERTLVNASDFYGDRYPTAALVPALATARFTITGTGSRPGI
jgi:PmbA protein